MPLSLEDTYIMRLRMNDRKQAEISNFTYNISYVCSANNEGVKNKDRAILTNKSKIITILVDIVALCMCMFQNHFYSNDMDVGTEVTSDRTHKFKCLLDDFWE